MTAETILNRKALRDFHILERYEAGLELKGSEVKSIRAGKANINDAFARIENGEAFLYNATSNPTNAPITKSPPPNQFANLCPIAPKSISFMVKPRSADAPSSFSICIGKTAN